MPKLPSIKPRQVIRFLEQNGFILDHTSGSHYISTIHPRTAAPSFHNTIAISPKGL